jgi:Arc/MetJ-type ribon-helix-helix transcriptional regulator
MPRKKKFEFRATVSLPEPLVKWLDEMVRQGVFSSLSHGIRRCVALAKTYSPEFKEES